MKNLPKLVLTDIDGVWTDGGMFYDNENREYKKFNTKDSVGVLYLKLFKIQIGIITGENTQIVSRRANKLNIKLLHQGITDKLKLAKQISEQLNIGFKDIAFIGDEINDLELLKLVGYSGTPKNASNLVKQNVDFITQSNGGEGAFKDFVIKLFENCGIYENELYEKYLINKKLNQ